MGLNQAQQDNLDQSLRWLRHRIAGADKRRNFELNYRKLDPEKSYADSFIDRLAEVE